MSDQTDLVKRLRKRWEGDDQCEGWEDCDCADDACEAAEEIQRLQAIVSNLRDERDVLALNFGSRESGVFVTLDSEGEVIGVAWAKPENASGSDNCTKLPRRFRDHEATQ
jgi:excinuclease UvrABC nuclease subunit